MKLQDKFRELQREGGALLATNFYNFETAKGIAMAAAGLEMPVILQASPASIRYMGPGVTVAIGRSVLDHFGVEGWLHLDHAHDSDLIKTCLDAGFDSVMIDASEQAVEDNISMTRSVVQMARAYEANVEAELGYVAKLGQSQEKAGFTRPEQAKQFVEETGIDALAVAIGSAHGFYDREPNLDLERLKEIHETVDVALVLHGGSGIPVAQLQEGIRRGIRKINVATELKDRFMGALQEELHDNTEIDLRKVFPVATEKLAELVREKLEIVKESTRDTSRS
ncbi:MAG: class II fructose-bisphosphate aldolase [Balneolaceae bacterium]|nr:class II fructose-bisphosphate aldolase [Balneolaceae bacterium]